MKGNELLRILQNLGLLEKALEQPNSAALIFAVPKLNADAFCEKQVLLWDAPANSDDVERALNETAQQLVRMDTRTSGDLRRVFQNPSKTSVAQKEVFRDDILVKFQADLQQFDELQECKAKMLLQIPQYAWEA
ncbi:hypothetical protein L914_13013 [Phytophthora nicotianae]|uniref:Uncharacterized protein n=1 Tax=Phytophthora nicotianae TaxID=4792 RepID=W2N0H5_PHYNI|nr:hypothetical protein L914_13013 [Phytophthora nicotianae]